MKLSIRHLKATLIFIWISLLFSSSIYAFSDAEKLDRLALIKQLKQEGEIVFAIVPKNTEIPFFKQSAKGCEDAAKRLGIKCIFFGSTEDNAHSQIDDIKALIDAGVDGLAISEYVEGWTEKRLGQTLTAWGKPVISFDSPINADFSRSYIGTDNYELGKQLGLEINTLKPEGGRYCIHTEREDSPNHMLRLKGITDGLLQNAGSHTKWINGNACPLFHHANLQSGITQMLHAIEWDDIDTYILTGGGPQFLLEPYHDAMLQYRDKILSGDLMIASIDTTPNQLTHLKNGLSTINLGQRPYDMGAISAEVLLKLHMGKEVEPIIHTGINVCFRDNADACTTND